jgi:hypothetical protein
MQSLAIAVPILPGMTEEVRKMYTVIDQERRKEFEESERKSGITKERDFLQVSPMGDVIILYLESDDMNKAFQTFATSKDSFDLWIKEQIRRTTGFDFDAPPSGPLPELIGSYDS